MLDRIKGGLFGVAIGDALGGTTEFLNEAEVKRQYGSVTEIIGGGYWDLLPGETTDDTAMTIAVAKGIIASPDDPIHKIGEQFIQWKNMNPKDIGNIIATTFHFYRDDWYVAAKLAHDELNGMSAGNGSLMRCLPVALAYSDLNKIKDVTEKQSKMTHYDDVAREACVIYNTIVFRVMNGEGLRKSIISAIRNSRYDLNYDREPVCEPNGYVVHTFQWVLYWLLNEDSFEKVIIGATNKGGDSDTIAAIAGGLKGIEVGFSKIPEKYHSVLLCKNVLTDLASKLYEIRGCRNF